MPQAMTPRAAAAAVQDRDEEVTYEPDGPDADVRMICAAKTGGRQAQRWTGRPRRAAFAMRVRLTRATSAAKRDRWRLEAYWPSKDVAARPSAAAAVLRVSCIRCCQELLRLPHELAC
jgi:hypothetical protein